MAEQATAPTHHAASAAFTLPPDCTLREIDSICGELLAWQPTATDLAIDCAQVEHSDLTLLEALFGARTFFARQGRNLALRAVPETMHHMFLRAGVTPGSFISAD